MKFLKTTLLISFVMVFVGCKKGDSTTTNTENLLDLPQVTTATGIMENFETGTKTSYTTGDVTLGTGVWTLNDALLGNTTSDRKNGTQSTRVRNSGKLTMKFNRTTGASTVTVLHALYGTDASCTWQL